MRHDTDTPTDDLTHRRNLAAALGYTLAEDVCALLDITPGTEASYRKRGRPVADYVVAGNAVLYRTESLAARLAERVRTGSRMAASEVL